MRRLKAMINAYNKLYLYNTQKNLGEAFDFAINGLKIQLNDFWNLFLNSKYSKKIEIGDYEPIVGMSGIELALRIVNKESVKNSFQSEDKTEEYWLGYYLAYFQWKTSMKFKSITEYVSIEEIKSMYNPYHEMDMEIFVDRLSEIINQRKIVTNLLRLRTQRGLSRSELSLLSNVPIRTLEQYEQGRKSINNAKAEYVIALAKALSCQPEDLLEI